MDFDSQTPRARLGYRVCLVLAMLLVLTKAVFLAIFLDGDLVSADNDSVMRLLSVRNWLAGQPWFDMVEYGLLPPDGVLMHWSRYIDAILGGMILLLSGFMSVAKAELWTVTIWPVFLSVVLILVIATGTRRLFGPMAGGFAALMASIWPISQQFYFLPMRIDHHNMQIVLIVIMTLSVMMPRAPLRAGLVAGLCGAFALAIGLETLAYILVLGLILFVRANLRITRDADPLLLGFSLVLFVASVAFWLGQTPPARLTAQVCDQLGLPVVTLTGIAALASVVPMLLLRDRTGARLALGVVIIALGCLLAWPLLGPCLAGPYGDLPPEVQEIISGSITEARPALFYAKNDVMLYLRLVLPVVGGLILGGAIWWRMPKDNPQDAARCDVIGMLIILGSVGFLASFSQIRLLLMSVPAAPVLVGVVMAVMVQRYLRSRGLGDATVMMVLFVLLVAPMLVKGPITQFGLVEKAPPLVNVDRTCRKTEDLAKINAIPPAVFLSSLNLGPPILLGTHHATISGPYHRSPDAFANGRLPFLMAEAEMQAYMRQTGATHLMLCRETNYGEGFARELANGASAEWLVPIPIDAGAILVFELAQEQ